ncbi:MAG: hypothetical protein N7Q72_03755, partial [Spiroplasma sp. Tabriz.8]|nr:hypothetical protein [Spiroplasma sp. Tabriz.8]
PTRMFWLARKSVIKLLLVTCLIINWYINFLWSYIYIYIYICRYLKTMHINSEIIVIVHRSIIKESISTKHI